MRLALALVILAAVGLTPQEAQAQWPTVRTPSPPTLAPRLGTRPEPYTWEPLRFQGAKQQALLVQPRSSEMLALGGLIGGVAGFVGGALIGAALCNCDSPSAGYGGIYAAALGGALGTTIGIPIGVHASNSARGKLGPAVASSADLRTR